MTPSDRPAVALAFNFLSGTSVVLGAIFILSVDISSAAVGLLLAFSSGVYLHIACTDCMPAVYAHATKPLQRLLCLALFILGAVFIGLVLLDHDHCSLQEPNITRIVTTAADGSSLVTESVTAGGDDAHEGHNH